MVFIFNIAGLAMKWGAWSRRAGEWGALPDCALTRAAETMRRPWPSLPSYAVRSNVGYPNVCRQEGVYCDAEECAALQAGRRARLQRHHHAVWADAGLAWGNSQRPARGWCARLERCWRASRSRTRSWSRLSTTRTWWPDKAPLRWRCWRRLVLRVEHCYRRIYFWVLCLFVIACCWMIHNFQVPNLDAIVVPIGGGGMVSGICVAAKVRQCCMRARVCVCVCVCMCVRVCVCVYIYKYIYLFACLCLSAVCEVGLFNNNNTMYICTRTITTAPIFGCLKLRASTPTSRCTEPSPSWQAMPSSLWKMASGPHCPHPPVSVGWHTPCRFNFIINICCCFYI